MTATNISNTLEFMRGNFNTRAQDYEQASNEPWGVMRDRLGLANLLRHMPTGKTIRVLDAGGGSGFYAIELARRGCYVELVDFADGMLDIARRNISTEGLEERVRINRADLTTALPGYRTDSYNVVLCHYVLEYISDYRHLFAEMSRVLKKDGVLSLAYHNCYAEAAHLVIRESNPKAALEALPCHATTANGFDASIRTFDPDEMNTEAKRAGLYLLADYGVRIFNDYLVNDQRKYEPGFFDALMELEAAAANLPPYKGIARYRHLLAAKK